jgi:hypothetical protein
MSASTIFKRIRTDIFKIPVIILFVLLTFNLKGQDYISYFNDCNEADKAYHYKAYDSALMKFEKAFTNIPYIHSRYLIKAGYCSSKLKQSEKSYYYIKKALLQGADGSILKQKELRRFRSTAYYTNLTDSLDFCREFAKKSINQYYRKAVDSLYFIDQNIVRGNHRDSTLFKTSVSVTEDYLYELDSLNFVFLLKLISEYGYPSEKLIGEKSYENASILLLHSIRKPWNSGYLEFMRNALCNGECLPADYAWTVDQSLDIRKMPVQFYYCEKNPNRLTEEQKEMTDNERRKFGVKPLEAFKVIEIFNMLITAPKW